MMIKTDNGGFTLIELSVVALIFALFAGMASPLLRNSLNAIGQETAVQDLLRLMAFAHERAILEHATYAIHLTPAENGYRLMRQTEEPGDPELQRIPGQWGQARRLPASIGFTGPETSVLFYPDGTATQAQLSLNGIGHDGSKGRAMDLSVDPVSGKGVFHEAL